MSNTEALRAALQAAREARDAIPLGAERSALNVALDRLDVALSAAAALAQQPADSPEPLRAMLAEAVEKLTATPAVPPGWQHGTYRTHLDQIDAEQEATAWLQAMVPYGPESAFWQWESFSFSPHDGRVYLIRKKERPVAAAMIVRDALNRSQVLRWMAAAPTPQQEPARAEGE